jgi:NAD dependent epimerase/dehydratase family enzyme
MHRPAIFPVPAVALRLAMGEMADALLLSSQRAVPQKLTCEGYSFASRNLKDALETVFSYA